MEVIASIIKGLGILVAYYGLMYLALRVTASFENKILLNTFGLIIGILLVLFLVGYIYYCVFQGEEK